MNILLVINYLSNKLGKSEPLECNFYKELNKHQVRYEPLGVYPINKYPETLGQKQAFR